MFAAARRHTHEEESQEQCRRNMERYRRLQETQAPTKEERTPGKEHVVREEGQMDLDAFRAPQYRLDAWQ